MSAWWRPHMEQEESDGGKVERAESKSGGKGGGVHGSAAAASNANAAAAAAAAAAAQLLDAAGLFAYWPRSEASSAAPGASSSHPLFGGAGGGAAAPSSFANHHLAHLPPGAYAMMGRHPPAPTYGVPPPPTAPAYGSLGTLGVAAGQAASLGINPASAAWWTMASHLAAQDYLARLQASGGLPFGGLPGDSPVPAFDLLSPHTSQPQAQPPSKSSSSGSKSSKSSSSRPPSRAGGRTAPTPPTSLAGPTSSAPPPPPPPPPRLPQPAHPMPLTSTASIVSSTATTTGIVSDPSSILGGVRLPPDTEIIKYTSSIVGPKVPGTTNRGRKKTISLDPPSVTVVPTTGGVALLPPPPPPHHLPAHLPPSPHFPPHHPIPGHLPQGRPLLPPPPSSSPAAAPSVGQSAERRRSSGSSSGAGRHVDPEFPTPSAVPALDRVEVIRLPPHGIGAVADPRSNEAALRNLRGHAPPPSAHPPAAAHNTSRRHGSSTLDSVPFPPSASPTPPSPRPDIDAPLNLSLKPQRTPAVPPAGHEPPICPSPPRAPVLLDLSLSGSGSQQSSQGTPRPRPPPVGQPSSIPGEPRISRRKPGPRPRRVIQAHPSTSPLAPVPLTAPVLSTSPLVPSATGLTSCPKAESPGRSDDSDMGGNKESRPPRNLGRGVSKPKKNTVASLLAQSRALGVKPTVACLERGVSPGRPPHSRSSEGSVESIHTIGLVSESPSGEVVQIGGSSMDSSTPTALCTKDLPQEELRDGTSVPSVKDIEGMSSPRVKSVEEGPKVSEGCAASVISFHTSDSEDDDDDQDRRLGGGESGDGMGNDIGGPAAKRRRVWSGTEGSIPDELKLRIPLERGWLRETVIRGLSRKGQIRGEVTYISPCGHRFQQHQEIIGYLEKNGTVDLTKDHFSFNSKLLMGDFLQPMGAITPGGNEECLRLSEVEVARRIEELRLSRPWVPHMPRRQPSETVVNARSEEDLHHVRDPRDAGHLQSRDHMQQHPGERERQAMLAREAKRLAREEVQRQREQARLAKEQEKLERQEAARRERELRAQQAMEERELKRQQAVLLKEQAVQLYMQELNKQREMLYTVELERERRRQHMLLVKALEGRKRLEERERRRQEVRAEKVASRERRAERRRVEMELVRELKKPVDDMQLRGTATFDDQKPLPALERIPNLKLSGQAFADTLMVFEFLHNFGETLGFDMDSLPSLGSLQKALLNEEEAEEELLSVMTHLLVCAIEDPGIPNPARHTTLLGQSLRQADITHANLSEILRIYLYANATGEVKALTGLCYERERERDREKRESALDALDSENPDLMASKPIFGGKNSAFFAHLRDNGTWRMSRWLRERPFLSLNPTRKAAILAFLCNELLQNKAVLRQIEGAIEGVAQLRRDRWTIEGKIRKLRLLHGRKFRQAHLVARRESCCEETGETPTNVFPATISVPLITDVQQQQPVVAKKTEEEGGSIAEAASGETAPATGGVATEAAAPTVPTTTPATTEDCPAKPEENKESEVKEVGTSTETLIIEAPAEEKAAAEKLVEKVEEKPAEKAEEKSAEKPVEKPAEKPAVKPVEEEEEEEEEDDKESGNESEGTQEGEVPEEEEDKNLSVEDLTRKIERITKQSEQSLAELARSASQLRAAALGQDRYWRRYWVLPCAGGVYVEGMESAEPELFKNSKLENDLFSTGAGDGEEEANTEQTKEGEETSADGGDADVEVKIESPQPQEDSSETCDDGAPPAKKPRMENDAEIVGNGAEDEEMDEVAAVPEEDEEEEKKDIKEDVKKVLDMCEPMDEVKTEESSEQDKDVKPIVKNHTEPNGVIKSEHEEEIILKKESEEVKEPKGVWNGEIGNGLVEPATTREAVKEENGEVESVTVNEIRSNDVGIETTPTIHPPSTPEHARPASQPSCQHVRPPSTRSTPLRFERLGDCVEEEEEARRRGREASGTECHGSENSNCRGSAVISSGALLGNGSAMQGGDPDVSVEASQAGPLLNLGFPLPAATPSPPTFPGGGASPGEKQWFGILPREACDETSLTRPPDDRAPSDATELRIPTYPRPSITVICPPSPPSPFSPLRECSPGPSGRPSRAESPLAGLPPEIFGPDDSLRLDVLKRMAEVFPEPKPVPKEYRCSWWRITDAAQLQAILEATHPRGVRERELRRTIARHVEHAMETSNTKQTEKACLSTLCRHGDRIATDLNPAMKNGTPSNPPPPSSSDWEEKEPERVKTPPVDADDEWRPHVALRVDMLMLEQVEALEDKVANASMQVKGWKVPNRATSEDGPGFRPACVQPEGEDDVRLNPLAIARDRLLSLEAAIERRYLKAPLGTSNSDLNLSGLSGDGSSTKDSSNKDSRGDTGGGNGSGGGGSSNEGEDVPKGLAIWREAVMRAETSAQLAMAFYMLEASIAWDKSIMKANCQFCHSGDNEDKLLLCDGCDKGYHTYCFRPKMENIPDGDWYCYECLNKVTGERNCIVCGRKVGKNLVQCDQCPRAYHTDCLQPPINKVPRGKWLCPNCHSKQPKKRGRRLKASESESGGGPAGSTSVQGSGGEDSEGHRSSAPSSSSSSGNRASSSPTRKEGRPKKGGSSGGPTGAAARELAACGGLLSLLEAHDDAWPFLLPVNTKQFPTYKKIIRSPMDLSTVRRRLQDGTYKSRDDFRTDIRLIFNNCETFNEDDSPVGKAGHGMRSFFETRWAEMYPH